MNPDLEFDLRDAAKNLANAYAELRAYKHITTRTEKLRPMKPTFGPGTPAPDHDWSFNIEHLLTHPRTDDDREQEAPVGLHEMVVDAQHHIHNQTIQTCDGYRLAMFVYTHAWEIADKFPAANDLLDLMRAQERYITREIQRRYPQHKQVRDVAAHYTNPTTGAGYATAAELAPLISRALARRIDRKHITYLGTSGAINTYLTPKGTKAYSLQEVLDICSRE